MAEEVNSRLFSLFHLALARKIALKYPNSFKEECQRIGKEIGQRVADDFFARNQITEKIKAEETEKYLNLFFRTYFSKDVEITDCTLRIKELFEDFPGMELLSSVLNEVFGCLSSEISFEVTEKGFLKYYSKKI